MKAITAAADDYGLERSIVQAAAIQKRIIGALILRDMKTRFGRSHVGYLLAIAWPLAHMLGIMAIQFVVGRITPIGTDLTIFVATGVLPYILCVYPARMTMLCIITNQPLLLFQIVKTTDILISRIILETLTSCLVCCLFVVILFSYGVDLKPVKMDNAVFAVLASIFLGISMGVFNTILFCLLRLVWYVSFILISIALYATSGAFILSSNLPETTRNVLWFNPLFQCVEWLRSGYYEGYGASSLSQEYVMGFSLACLFLGLAGERILRGHLYLNR